MFAYAYNVCFYPKMFSAIIVYWNMHIHTCHKSNAYNGRVYFSGHQATAFTSTSYHRDITGFKSLKKSLRTKTNMHLKPGSVRLLSEATSRGKLVHTTFFDNCVRQFECVCMCVGNRFD